MTTEDPWAHADDATGSTGSAPAETSFDDEFGTEQNPESAVGSSLPVGTKLPGFPKMNQLYGRLLIVKPISYDPAAETYAARMGQDGPKTEEQFRVQVVVLAGDPISVDEIEKQEDGTWKKTGEKVTPDYPVSFWNLTVRQGKLIGQLKKKFDVETGEAKDGGKWLGVLRRSAAGKAFPAAVRNLPFPAQYDACDQMYAENREAQRAAIESGNEVPAAPKFSPMIADATAHPKARELAMAFLKAERAARNAA